MVNPCFRTVSECFRSLERATTPYRRSRRPTASGRAAGTSVRVHPNRTPGRRWRENRSSGAWLLLLAYGPALIWLVALLVRS
ncbi:MAG: hypothetical protein ACYTGN_12675 [Planctomycetota bacterium]|jgi:hypothetical protein